MNTAELRSTSERLAGALPELMAHAERLASTVIMGGHGRKRAGQGELFWQYRPTQMGDDPRRIDWRRSARSDATFIQEREWQSAQTTLMWVNSASSMQYTTGDTTKAERARLLALALSILLLRGGERVGLAGPDVPARGGQHQPMQIASGLLDASAPPLNPGRVPAHGHVVLISDFFTDIEPLRRALALCTQKGATGVILQVLDPSETAFPFKGRVRFEDMSGAEDYETQSAGDLRTRYLERLAERQAEMRQLARQSGFLFHTHTTDASALSALLWLYHAVART